MLLFASPPRPVPPARPRRRLLAVLSGCCVAVAALLCVPAAWAVSPTPTTTELEASPSTLLAGETVTYTATVTPAPDSGTVAFKEGGTPITGCETQAVNVTTGIATCETTYATPGVREATASFSGDTLYKSSSSSPATKTTVQTDTSTRLEASATRSKNEPVTYTATVTPDPDGGTVAFKDGGTPITGCATQAVNTTTGIATCTTFLSTAGFHTITASFSGSSDTVYRPSTSSGTVTTVPTETRTTLQVSTIPTGGRGKRHLHGDRHARARRRDRRLQGRRHADQRLCGPTGQHHHRHRHLRTQLLRRRRTRHHRLVLGIPRHGLPTLHLARVRNQGAAGATAPAGDDSPRDGHVGIRDEGRREALGGA